MDREIRLVARLVALLSALIFIGLLALTIVAFAAQRQFLRPDPYLRALDDLGAHERTPAILAQLLTSTINNGRTGLASQLPLPEVSQSDVELFLAAFLPTEWVQTQSDVIVRALVADLNGEPLPDPSTLSLQALKERLNSPAGAQALVAVIETRPACGAADLSALTCGFNLAGEIACRPPALNLEICGAALVAATGGMATLLPDEVNLQGVLDVLAVLLGPLRTDAQNYAGAISFMARFGWFLTLPFLLGLTLFGVRSAVGWLRWWGAPLLGAALSLLPLIALMLFSPTWYLDATLSAMAQNAPALAQLTGDVAGMLSRGFVLQLGVAAALLGAVGGGMVALSLVLPLAQRWMRQGSSNI